MVASLCNKRYVLLGWSDTYARSFFFLFTTVNRVNQIHLLMLKLVVIFS